MSTLTNVCVAKPECRKIVKPEPFGTIQVAGREVVKWTNEMSDGDVGDGGVSSEVRHGQRLRGRRAAHMRPRAQGVQVQGQVLGPLPHRHLPPRSR
ncbi:hypothetical protein TNCV_2858681 [Trichonephila clavipes]|nr:hypothetical protein TNCV_2858681 [Trichonephila clavipes]